MRRRDFLKVSGAAVLASQLPNVGEAKAEPLVEQGEYVGYTNFPQDPVARRRAVFLSGYYPDDGTDTTLGPPPAGTLVASENNKQLFAVREKVDVPVIGYITSGFDEQRYGTRSGYCYWGHVMVVEAIAPGAAYHSSKIRNLVTPNTGYLGVCEDWRVERYGGDPAAPVLAINVLEPDTWEYAVKTGLSPVWTINASGKPIVRWEKP